MDDLKLQLPYTTRPKPHLLNLPTEIRLHILEYVFGYTELFYQLSLPEKRGFANMRPSKVVLTEKDTHLGVLRTCKILFHEGLDVSRRSTKVVFEGGADETFETFLLKTPAPTKLRIVSLNCVYLPPTNIKNCLSQLTQLRSVHIFVLIDDHDGRDHWSKTQLKRATAKDFEALLRTNEFDVAPLKGFRNQRGRVELTIGFETPYYPLKNRRVRTIPCLYDVNKKTVHRFWNRDEYPGPSI